MIWWASKAESFLARDPLLGPCVKKAGKCRIVASDPKKYFEDLVDAIVGQQLSGKAAETIFGRLKKLAGKKMTAKKLLSLTDEQFQSVGVSRQKRGYIRDLASKVESKLVQLVKLDQLGDEEIKRELIAVKGIGPWTAEMFLMFSLGRPDVFSAGDLGLKKALQKLPGKVDPDRWKPYRTAACWYLWRISA